MPVFRVEGSPDKPGELRIELSGRPGEFLTLHRFRRWLVYTPGDNEWMWLESQVVFAAVHVVGSNNGYANWTGYGAPTVAQQAEVDGRIAAALGWIEEAFETAEEEGARGVVLMMQADTFAGANESLRVRSGRQFAVRRFRR